MRLRRSSPTHVTMKTSVARPRTSPNRSRKSSVFPVGLTEYSTIAFGERLVALKVARMAPDGESSETSTRVGGRCGGSGTQSGTGPV